jgi:hypothetical protein
MARTRQWTIRGIAVGMTLVALAAFGLLSPGSSQAGPGCCQEFSECTYAGACYSAGACNAVNQRCVVGGSCWWESGC